jgi:hypothetical protein
MVDDPVTPRMDGALRLSTHQSQAAEVLIDVAWNFMFLPCDHDPYECSLGEVNISPANIFSLKYLIYFDVVL